MPLCSVCKIDFASVDALYLHLKIRERINENAEFKCQERNCWRDFANWKTFRKHLIQNHKYPVYVHPSSNKSDLSSISIEDVESVVSPVITDNRIDDRNGGVSVDSDISDALTVQFLKESVRNSLMTFISKLYADPNLPRKHIQLLMIQLLMIYTNFSLI